jgi:hypothetical protein
MLPQASATVAKTAGLGLKLSGANTASIGGTIDAIVISVTDVSSRCPQTYRTSQSDVWIGGSNVVEKSM